MLGNLTLGGDDAGDFPARQGCRRPSSSGIPYPKRHERLPYQTRMLGLAPPKRKRRNPILRGRRLATERPKLSEDGKIRAPCMIRGVRAAKRAPSWQDMRAVYSRKAICGAFRMHRAHILPKPARFGCMARESYQEGALFPSEAPFGMHGAKKLPRIAAWERIRAQSCHGKAPENAPRRNIATASRSRMHFAYILPSPAAQVLIAREYCRSKAPRSATSYAWRWTLKAGLRSVDADANRLASFVQAGSCPSCRPACAPSRGSTATWMRNAEQTRRANEHRTLARD